MKTRLPIVVLSVPKLPSATVSALVLAFILCLGVVTISTAQTINWQKALGGSKNDSVTAILATADGGYVVAGSTTSNDGEISDYRGGAHDAWIVKLNSAGTIIWKKTIGGMGDDQASALTASPDGGYVVTGLTTSRDGDMSGFNPFIPIYIWVFKINSAGEIVWKQYRDEARGLYATSVTTASDGGYLVAGHTFNRGLKPGGAHLFAVIKFSGVGDFMWDHYFGGIDGSDELYAVTATSDGGCVVAGRTSSYQLSWSYGTGYPSQPISVGTDHNKNNTGHHYDNTNDVFVGKLNREGTIGWYKFFGGSGHDIANAVKETADGGFLVGGYTESNDGDVSGNHGGGDAWLLKLTSTGSLTWQKTIGGSGKDNMYAPTTMPDGAYMLAGTTTSNDGDVSGNHGGSDAWLVKLNSAGDIISQKTYGGTGFDAALAITATVDGSYVLAGSTTSNDGDVTGNHGDQDAWVVKLGSDSPPQKDALTFLSPTYQCETGWLVLNTTGGDGAPIDYKVPGLRDWGSSPEFFVPTYQRSGMVFTLYARQSGKEYTTQYTNSCATQLTLIPPTYQCESGRLVLNITGGNGTSIEYKVPGLRDWGLSPEFFVPTYQRNGMVFTIYARQSGQEYTAQYTSACANQLTLIPPTYQCETGKLVLNSTGGDGSAIEYKAPGLRDWGLSPEFFVPTYQRNGMVFTLYARQSGKEYTTQYTSACASQLTLIPPTYQCETGKLVLGSTGGDGSAIEYKVPGLRDWGLSAEFFVPTYQRNGMVFTLYARQRGQEYTTQYTTTCNLVSARLASSLEVGTGLQVKLLGNPVNQEVVAEVTGVQGQALQVKLTDIRGRVVGQQQIEQAQVAERLVLSLPIEDSSLLLLEVATSTERKTLRVLSK
ncbi:hypothetical protein EXU85_02330 [Spirosoma sp. KCTC 42546]|uniref:hypothetical protein n=1 Tax=Spirosoma sp. KCTC 42546 TaxID=2520506 RepID=UPI001158C270|nr:hypothetical protein [Spirosoma sp. KCTC 42546]QDK77495.1 hypothetical protein EXU85_02330 [Spirosoma sp. KCTC 42546]